MRKINARFYLICLSDLKLSQYISEKIGELEVGRLKSGNIARFPVFELEILQAPEIGLYMNIKKQ